MGEFGDFANEPVLELRRADVRGRLTDALARLDAMLPLEVPVIIAGERRTGETFTSTDPGDPERIVANASAASAEADLAAAIAAARDGARQWAGTPAEQRADALLRAAAWLRERRLELAALEVRECAKPWPEADADVCEAIDFLEYYARAAVMLARGRPLLQVPGERNELRYVPRGVVGVISPWNFPLAIPCGMTAAALATGNAVVLKPAEQSPGCAQRLLEALTRRRGAARRRSRCCPATATSERRSCATRRCTRSRSPARCRSGSRSCARPPRWSRASTTSSASWPSSAARTA